VGFYLGVDGGGSKTSCVIGDETSILGSGVAGPSNAVRVGEARARESLSAAIRQTCTAAGIAPQNITATCVGVAGAARSEISETMRHIVSEIVPGHIEVVGDTTIALHAAFGDRPGVIVIAGTGSIAYGRNQPGDIARAGGWGFAASDEGSGHWIGRRAVSVTMRAHDEGEDTLLTARVLETLGAHSWDEFVLAANASPPPDFAALVPGVLAAADSGDSLARSILAEAGAALADVAGVVIRRLFPETGDVPMAMSGGVFRNSAVVRQVFYNQVRSEYPRVVMNPTVIEPVRGALELARKAGSR
jgi:glucosamine kinase